MRRSFFSSFAIFLMFISFTYVSIYVIFRSKRFLLCFPYISSRFFLCLLGRFVH